MIPRALLSVILTTALGNFRFTLQKAGADPEAAGITPMHDRRLQGR